MEEPELRVGGWEKEKGRSTFRKLFNLILILVIAFAFIGPSVINYNPAYVPSESLYLANGMWNGPFDVHYSKQFSGHIKVSSVTYETTLDNSGELRVISMSSFMYVWGLHSIESEGVLARIFWTSTLVCAFTRKSVIFMTPSFFGCNS